MSNRDGYSASINDIPDEPNPIIGYEYKDTPIDYSKVHRIIRVVDSKVVKQLAYIGIITGMLLAGFVGFILGLMVNG